MFSLFIVALLFLIFSTTLSQTTYTFTNCEQEGRYGPSQGDCDSEYLGEGLEGQVVLNNGIQEWVVPQSGTLLELTLEGVPTGLSGIVVSRKSFIFFLSTSGKSRENLSLNFLFLKHTI